MASQFKVRQYLAYWLQLGKKVLIRNGAIALPQQPTILKGDRYSSEFEDCWQQARSPDSGDCYLEGTDETIAELLTPTWEIDDCPRCTMPIPQRTQGMPPLNCPCNDLPTWPNMEVPLPRSPVSNQNKLMGIYSRLHQMGERADLYASSLGEDINKYKKTQEAIERLRRQNELILNSAGEGICGLDVQANVTFINPAATQMLKYEDVELISQPIDIFLRPLKSDAISSSVAPESPIYATLKNGSVQYVTDAVFWRSDGTSFPVEYVSAPIREAGEIVGAVVTFKDITERQEVERIKDELISIVSHELRTPLTSMRGALGLLASGMLAAKPEMAQHLLEIAVENTERLVRLIDDILNLQSLESGQVPIAPIVCDAANLMKQAADAMQTMADKAGIMLLISPGVEAQNLVWADPDRLIQVLTNLLSNAIKFSPPGTTVVLTYQSLGEQLLFSVSDRGQGIPPDKLEIIFERFQQVNASDSRAFGGTGLGLAICRSIVQKHGGRIWAESILGEGSTFYFTLPMVRSGFGRRSGC